MRVYQGEIVEVNFLLPSGEYKPHPTIVISNNIVHETEEAFIGVMISSSAPDDEFSYHITNDMITKPAKKACQARIQLISLIPEKQVLGKFGNIKKKYLQELIAKINAIVFNLE